LSCVGCLSAKVYSHYWPWIERQLNRCWGPIVLSL